jgi:hypothetical protein
MITNPQNNGQARVVRKTKVETTYEYVPIFGEILGLWRKIDSARHGEEIHIELNHRFEEYDRLYVNGQEVEIHSKK